MSVPNPPCDEPNFDGSVLCNDCEELLECPFTRNGNGCEELKVCPICGHNPEKTQAEEDALRIRAEAAEERMERYKKAGDELQNIFRSWLSGENILRSRIDRALEQWDGVKGGGE